MSSKHPFFIVGCVRSGTTLLRKILDSHPCLVSPEETQFYRWGQPFGTPEYMQRVRNNPILKKHRQIDGIEESLFADILENSTSRRDLYTRYMEAFSAKRKPLATRWFDKSPQNIYGATLILSDFPDAKIVHIVRHPYNVAASLRLGKVMSIPQLLGACNYWTEAVAIAARLKALLPAQVYELRYERLVGDAAGEIGKLLAFLGEDANGITFPLENIHPERNQHRQTLTDDDRRMIDTICGRWMRHYGYVPETAPQPTAAPQQT